MTTELPAAIAVLNQVYRYAELIDEGDYDGMGELFADGSITTEGPAAQENRGREAVTAMYTVWTRRYPDGTPRTKHVLTNPIVTVAETTATVRSYFTVLQQTDELALQPIIAGRYRDDFEFVDRGWRFVNKHIITDLVGDLSHHLLRSL
jgi:3-phenylpropionate/cinnamic acid dioxygenase small subunit